MGTPRAPAPRLGAADAAEAARLYAAGASLNALARRFGTSDHRVKAALEAAGTRLRPPPGARRRRGAP